VNIKGILAESRFYEAEIDGQLVSLEASLTALEDEVRPILARIMETRRLDAITAAERQVLAEFCAVQIIRTQTFRDRMGLLNEGITGALQQRGVDLSQVANFKLPTEQESKSLALEMLVEAPHKYAPHFLSKRWYLVGGSVEDPFHLGDHPVVLDNNFGEGMGLASPGITIYLPLCPTLCLGMTDPSATSKLFVARRNIDNNYRQMKKECSRRGFSPGDREVLEEMKKTLAEANRRIYPIEMGTPTDYDPQSVMRVNSLQVIYSSRWIISSREDFSLPQLMIADNEKNRTRPTIQFD
jgi:hypothetical protein